mmetsp:Transcript_99864/g.164205  ORF Transcript_99864/g.164205 Transcript_99864/m.164205 type:complete len:103 (+) Transcript_99864:316-624(+)
MHISAQPGIFKHEAGLLQRLHAVQQATPTSTSDGNLVSGSISGDNPPHRATQAHFQSGGGWNDLEFWQPLEPQLAAPRYGPKLQTCTADSRPNVHCSHCGTC